LQSFKSKKNLLLVEKLELEDQEEKIFKNFELSYFPDHGKEIYGEDPNWKTARKKMKKNEKEIIELKNKIREIEEKMHSAKTLIEIDDEQINKLTKEIKELEERILSIKIRKY